LRAELNVVQTLLKSSLCCRQHLIVLATLTPVGVKGKLPWIIDPCVAGGVGWPNAAKLPVPFTRSTLRVLILKAMRISSCCVKARNLSESRNPSNAQNVQWVCKVDAQSPDLTLEQKGINILPERPLPQRRIQMSSAPNPQSDADQLEAAVNQAIAAWGGDTPKGTGAGATLDCEMPRLCTQRGRGKQKMNINQNSLPDLIEVLMRVVNSNEEDHRDVRVELRVNSVSLVADDCLEFVVELDRANLSLDLDGFEVVPKSRYGEPSKSNDVAIKHKLTNETVLQGEVPSQTRT
jgi:hypothetical protein